MAGKRAATATRSRGRASQPRVSVLVADDHLTYAEALAEALRARGDLRVQVASLRDDLVAAAQRSRPQVLLLDLDTRGPAVAELVRRLRAAHPEGRVLLLTGREDDYLRALAVEAGAAGFVSKFTPLASLARLLRAAAAGEPVTEREELARLGRVLRHRRQQEATERQRAGRLTPRQLEILQLLADGVPPREISERLGMSHFTFRTHVQNILTRLGVHTKLEAVALAIRHGKISARV
ncbi:MAG TPA: response regulator transcription factor [Actinomycetota bacterium]|nr:response regulator transcription factor [Actinomycetota bacterium]